MSWPFANDHPDGPFFLQLIIRMDRPFQMIIRMGWPFANDHPDFFLSTRFFSIFFIFSKLLITPPTNIIFSFKTFLLLLLLQILGPRFNLSRTMCSCFFSFCLVFFQCTNQKLFGIASKLACIVVSWVPHHHHFVSAPLRLQPILALSLHWPGFTCTWNSFHILAFFLFFCFLFIF